MVIKSTPAARTKSLTSALALCAMLGNVAAPIKAFASQNVNDTATATPIKHVIVIIGENRSFDHVFATYVPKNKGDTVLNLLSEGIVNADGAPGKNYKNAIQQQATDTSAFQLSPSKTAYATLPIAYVGGPATPYVCSELGLSGESCPQSTTNLAYAQAIENGLDSGYYQYLLTGGTGQSGKVPDARIYYNGQSASSLPPGPYQITQSTQAPYYPYDSYSPSPVHRFFQMWQQLDCDATKAKAGKGWGCTYDQAAWVERTVGAGSNGAAESGYLGEGSTALGFYNVQQGDAPYFKYLADNFTMSDNYHQGVNGGTGANHIVIGYADAIWFSDGRGNAQVPPQNPVNATTPGTPVPPYTSALSEIENPNPMPGTNNFYTQDGYGGGSGSPTAKSPTADYGGGSYVGCADKTQPGVPAITDYLKALPSPVRPNCDDGHYYLVNNYNPGYFGDGSNAYTDTNANNYVFTIPPTAVKNIGQALDEKNVSWAYFGDQWDEYLGDKYQQNSSLDEYCNICNWAAYSTAIMTNKSERETHLLDTADLYQELEQGSGLPAVSYVKPSGYVDGHPSSSKLILFEGFVKKIVDLVQKSPYWANTAILVTFDEGGGYWDSGYVQPVDFFGDGTRIPMIAISKYSTGGHISHTYNDHVSIAKFIEANWGLAPLTSRSRDNLPNPLTASNPYVPVNSPAIGDLMDMFDFSH